MNTILYIGDSYVTSLSQFCGLFPNYISPKDSIYDEVLTSFLDGILEQWLTEGDAECKVIAQRIKEIDKKQSNSKMMKQIIASFPDLKKIVLEEFKYLSLKKVVCRANTKETELKNRGLYEIESEYKDNVAIEVTFSINEIENESFDIRLIDNGEDVFSHFIDLKSLSEDEIKKGEKKIEFTVRFPDEREHNLKLNTDNIQIFETSFNISQSKNYSDSGVNLKSILEKETIAVKGVKFKMVRVEGCTFMLGATLEQEGDAYGGEYPVHEVTLSDYSIGEMQVTQELWKAVMESNPSKYIGNKLPVENVSWNDCQEFISKLNAITKRKFRLPTEAEWEYAARGGNKRKVYKYAGSNSIGDVAWYDENSGGCTHEVGSKHPNELELYDMSGNVWEWCNDWFGEYSSDSQTNPTGPSSGSTRVNRGGGWGGNARSCRVSDRGGYTPDSRGSILGLRLAL